MKNLVIALAFCCALNASPAVASPEPWNSLPLAEQEALTPVRPQWNSLPEAQQQNFRHLARQYPKLTADEKQRFSSRLATWARLTPAQRQAARDKYRAFSLIPKDKREQVKLMIKQQNQPPASAATR